MNLYKLNKLKSLRYQYGGQIDQKVLHDMYRDIMQNHPSWNPENIHQASIESGGLKGTELE